MFVTDTCKECIDTIETFDFNELKICDEFASISVGEPYDGKGKAYTMFKFKLDYKGGKPTFRLDGNSAFILLS